MAAAVVLAPAAMLFAPDCAGASSHEPALLEETMEMRGSHGFELTLVVVDRHEVLLEAEKRAGPRADLTVAYATSIRRRPGLGIDAKIGGLGRIDLEFEPESTRTYEGPSGCTGGSERVQRGHFIGLILFHGERDYTSVRRHSPAGTVDRTSAGTCPDSGPSTGVLESQESISSSPLDSLSSASRSSDQGFEANRYERTGTDGGHVATYRAYVGGRAHGVDWTSTATVEVPSLAGFMVAGGAGLPEAATVRPPAPFAGSATFSLLSPTRAAWTGDLAVRMPNLGRVRLAGPGDQATLCDASSCAKTFPPGTAQEEEP
jgi:hypothetical protein